MTKTSGPKTEPWGTPQEDVRQEDRSVSHLTREQRDHIPPSPFPVYDITSGSSHTIRYDKIATRVVSYDLNQLKTEPWTPNQNERRVIKICHSQ